jgi:valyl-tRNA synthetase
LHPIICDRHGRKMCKSIGNIIDPLEVINGMTVDGLLKCLKEGNLDPIELNIIKEWKLKDYPDGIPECGTDALRFALISCTSQVCNHIFISVLLHYNCSSEV